MANHIDNETKTVTKVIWAWQDEKEENWLEQMALDGWHLTAVKPFVYTFRHGNPEKMTYRMDYKLSIDKDYAEYTAIFADCGWELAATMANWHYYRINPGNAATPEIYNTSRSKPKKIVASW